MDEIRPETLQKIKIIVMDVDGTLTDGKLYIAENRDDMKAFNVKDGFAIAQWIAHGGKAAIITGKGSNIVKRRGEELGISYIMQEVKSKTAALRDILIKEGLTLFEVCYIGDDINDLAVMSQVALACAPADAVYEVKKAADFITSRNGGQGAVRELLEMIMKANGMWEEITDSFMNEV